MSQGNEIKSEKILLKDLFDMWFRIPEYQRPYVWGYDQVHDLLDDLTFAASNRPDADYFLGTLVFQTKPANSEVGRDFEENDLLDGQQRLTSLLLLLAVVRDLSSDLKFKAACQRCIYQEPDPYKQIPERSRLDYAIREDAKNFYDVYVKADGGTLLTKSLESATVRGADVSASNMAKAIVTMREFFALSDVTVMDALLKFILNKVLLIYVATENLEDAFRLFTILNNRGIPLRNSDILKSINLGALEGKDEMTKYAAMWEEAEAELGDDFDRFLTYLRTILVREKARLSLLKEFEDKIYDPKERDKVTGLPKPILLHKGKPTFVLVETFLAHYKQLLGGSNYNVCKSFAFDNLIKVMKTGLPATDWIPPLLAYYKKFGDERLFDFLKKLNAKFGGDWLSQQTPTNRIDAMNDLLRAIDDSASTDEVLSTPSFTFDSESLVRTLQGEIYGRRFAMYVLLLLDYVYQNPHQKMHFETLSVEHVLPQSPEDGSQWKVDFTEEERGRWTDRLGNLVLITCRKNTSQGRLDYKAKKKKYFEKNIDNCPNSIRVLNTYAIWTPKEVATNQDEAQAKIGEFFGLPDQRGA